MFGEVLGKNFEGNKLEIIKRHVEVLRENYDEDWLTLYLRKHFLWYVSGEEGASKIRLELATSPSVDESLRLLSEIYGK